MRHPNVYFPITLVLSVRFLLLPFRVIIFAIAVAVLPLNTKYIISLAAPSDRDYHHEHTQSSLDSTKLSRENLKGPQKWYVQMKPRMIAHEVTRLTVLPVYPRRRRRRQPSGPPSTDDSNSPNRCDSDASSRSNSRQSSCHTHNQHPTHWRRGRSSGSLHPKLVHRLRLFSRSYHRVNHRHIIDLLRNLRNS